MGREIIISADQNEVTIDGVKTVFKPIKKWKNKCHKCWWLRFATTKECENIPCSHYERNDKIEGVFTIQEMPKV